MIRVGITGQAGFIGTNLYNYLSQSSNKYLMVPFQDSFFYEPRALKSFVEQCDIVIHLAAVMRATMPGEVYTINMQLIEKLIAAMDHCKVTPNIIFASSIQDNNGSEYGNSKRDGIFLVQKWAKKMNTNAVVVRFPNLFGPHAKPNYSSFIATFCYKLTHNEIPTILQDNDIPLVYINNIAPKISQIIDDTFQGKKYDTINFAPDRIVKVSTILNMLKYFKETTTNGLSPNLTDSFEKDLYDTYKSYINYKL